MLAESWTPVSTIVGKTWGLHLEKVVQVDREENLRMIAESVAFLVASGKRVIYDAEHFFDGYRDDPAYAIECLQAALEAGAENLTMCDTNGASLPHEIAEAVHVVRRALPNAALGHPHPQRRRVRGRELARRRSPRAPAGPGHDERLRRALRQREPDLDHPEPAAQDGLRSACRRWRG